MQSHDKSAAQRLQQLDQQLQALKAEQAELSKRWEKEKEEMRRLQSIKNEIDRVNLEIQAAERDYDLNRAAELKYGTLLQLQKQLKEAEEALELETVSRPAGMNEPMYLKQGAFERELSKKRAVSMQLR